MDPVALFANAVDIFIAERSGRLLRDQMNDRNRSLHLVRPLLHEMELPLLRRLKLHQPVRISTILPFDRLLKQTLLIGCGRLKQQRPVHTDAAVLRLVRLPKLEVKSPLPYVIDEQKQQQADRRKHPYVEHISGLERCSLPSKIKSNNS